MIKFLLFSGIVLLFGTVCAQTAVTWENLKSATLSSTTLSKVNGAVKAQASSRNLLHGSYSEAYVNGSFSFTNSGALNQMKTIGFAVLESQETGFELIEYGFSFSNNSVKAYGKDSYSETALASGQTFKLERLNDKLKFYVNSTLVYEELIDISEYLVVRAQLKSNASTFSGVTVSFDGSRPIIDPTITTSTKTIALNTGSTFPLIQWEDGEKGATTKKFISSTYNAEIYDSHARRITRAFSVGEDAVWQNLSGVSVSGTTISKTSGNNWGTATSQTTFSNTESFWAETAFLSQSDSKAFGFVLASANLQNTSALQAGFIIGKDYQLQLIQSGSTVKTLDAYDKDRLNITYRSGKITWYVNGTIAYEAQSTFSGNVKAAVLLRNGTSFTQIQHTKETSRFTTTWDNATERGAITVNVSGISGVSGPYHYLISEESYVLPFHDIYQLTKDSVFGGTLDSLGFYTGNVSSSSYTFTELPMNSYHVSVFNSLGQRILGDFVNLKPAISLLYSDGITLSNGNFVSSKDNAKAELSLFLDETVEKGSLGFVVNDKSTNHSIGFIEQDQDIANLNLVTHGFAIHNGKVKTVESGIESSTSYPIKKEAKLLIEKQDQELVLKINGKERERITIDPEISLRGAVVIEKAQKEIKPPQERQALIQPLSLKTEIIGGDCSGLTGSVQFSYKNNENGYNYNISNISFLNPQNQVINYNSLNVSGSTSTYTYSNLSADEYTLQYTYTVFKLVSGQPVSYGNFSVTKKISVGYPMEWLNMVNTVYSQIDESLTNTSSMQNPVIGYATSDKRIETLYQNNETYWIDFQVSLKLPPAEVIHLGPGGEIPGGHGGGVFIVPRVSFNEMESSQNATSGLPEQSKSYSFERLENVYTLITPDFQVFSYNPTDVFRIKFEASGQVILLKNGIQIHAYNNGLINRPKLINAFMENAQNSFYKVYTNLPCPNIIYAKLDRKLTGVKYRPIENKLYFAYQEEYTDLPSGLNYKVFKVNNHKNEVLNNSNNALLNYKYGDNRFAMDVSSLQSGVYTLEIENIKKEKFYLRFIK